MQGSGFVTALVSVSPSVLAMLCCYHYFQQLCRDIAAWQGRIVVLSVES